MSDGLIDEREEKLLTKLAKVLDITSEEVSYKIGDFLVRKNGGSLLFNKNVVDRWSSFRSVK